MTSAEMSSRGCYQQVDVRFLFFVFVLTALDSFFLFFGLGNTMASMTLVFLFHLGSCVLFLIVFHRQLRRNFFYAFAPLAVLVLGPLGGIVSIASHLLSVLFRRTSARTFESWYYELFPDTVDASDSRQSQTGKLAEGRLKPFVDVIDHGTLEQKRAVVASMARAFKPVFAPALKAALRDHDVRGLAATAVAKIEQDFSVRWQQLETYINEHPGEVKRRGMLARLLDDYAYLGIFDGDREKELRLRAEAALVDAITFNPEDSHAIVRLGRLHIRQGRPLEAEKILWPIVNQAQDTKAIYWYCESLFKLGRTRELQLLLEQWHSRLLCDETVPAHFLRAVEMWRVPASKHEAAS